MGGSGAADIGKTHQGGPKISSTDIRHPGTAGSASAVWPAPTPRRRAYSRRLTAISKAASEGASPLGIRGTILPAISSALPSNRARSSSVAAGRVAEVMAHLPDPPAGQPRCDLGRLGLDL